MRALRICSVLVLLFTGAGFLVAFANGQDPGAQIKAEIERLQQSLKERPIADKDFGDIASMAGSTLKASADARDGGQLYLSLEKLGQGEDLLGAARAGV